MNKQARGSYGQLPEGFILSLSKGGESKSSQRLDADKKSRNVRSRAISTRTKTRDASDHE
jgi:hypothetical protein